MKIITKWNHILELEGGISDGLQQEIRDYYTTIAMEMGEETVETFDMADIGIIAILEASDDYMNLPLIGMTIETTTVLESIPEFVDVLIIEDEIWYRVTIILSADAGRVIYMPNSLVTGELKAWIAKWKHG